MAAALSGLKMLEMMAALMMKTELIMEAALEMLEMVAELMTVW